MIQLVEKLLIEIRRGLLDDLEWVNVVAQSDEMVEVFMEEERVVKLCCLLFIENENCRCQRRFHP